MSSRSDLRTFLKTLDTDTLADLLYTQSERDPRLRRQLLARAGGADAGELAEVSDLLEDPTATAESVQLGSVLDTLQRLLDAGTTADVAPLAKRTVDRILTATDDSDTCGLAEHRDRAVSLYARACAAHPPPAAELADWITRVAFAEPAPPDVCLAEFADALGADGLDHVRAAVDAVLSEGHAAGGDREETARRLRLELAEITGDVDAVVRLLSEQLPRLDVSLKIVRVLRAAGRHADAIAHAATALGNTAGGGRGAVVEALERVRAQQPSGEPWQARTPAAGRSAKRVPEDSRAVDAVEASADPRVTVAPAEAGGAPGPTDGGAVEAPATALGTTVSADAPGARAPADGGEPEAPVDARAVEALLHDDRRDEAWRLVTTQASTEVIDVYRADIERLIASRNPAQYAKAAGQLRRLRTLHRRAGTARDFTGYLGELVEAHRRKTRLLDEIRKARIALPKTAPIRNEGR